MRAKQWNPTVLMKVVDDFLRSKFMYTPESVETLLTPDYSLQGLEQNGVIRGDCDDISILHAAILTCMDIPVRFVAIRSVQEDPNYDHVFIEAWDGKTWKMFDTTIPLGTPVQYYSRVNVSI